jgi:hypothetical protein
MIYYLSQSMYYITLYLKSIAMQVMWCTLTVLTCFNIYIFLRGLTIMIQHRNYLISVHLKDDVRFEVFTVVTMKNGVFWDVMPCGSCKNRRFGGTQLLHHQGDKNWWTRNLSVTSNWRTQHASVASYSYVPSSPIFVTLKMEELSSSETSVLTRVTGITSQKTPFFTFRMTLESSPGYRVLRTSIWCRSVHSVLYCDNTFVAWFWRHCNNPASVTETLLQ